MRQAGGGHGPFDAASGNAHSQAYSAFLSYSHLADSLLAAELQSALQKFAKPLLSLRAIHIFRDKTDLSANPGLWSRIAAALDQSEFFLLLASPHSARSRWVKRELDHWLSRHDGLPEKLLILWTDGVLAWDVAANDFDWNKTDALPRVLDWKESIEPATLAGRFKEEPFFIDFRRSLQAADLSARNADFLDKVATIAAELRHESKSILIGRDVREYRRARSFRVTAITALVIFALATSIAGIVAYARQQEAVAARIFAEQRLQEAIQARKAANRAAANEISQRKVAEAAARLEQQARVAEFGARKEAERQRDQARMRELTAYAALSQSDDPALALYVGSRAASEPGPLSAGLESILATALTNVPSYAVLRGSTGVNTIAWSPSGSTLAYSSTNTIQLWDVASTQRIVTLDGHATTVNSIAWSLTEPWWLPAVTIRLFGYGMRRLGVRSAHCLVIWMVSQA